ncbi:hypothetical protein ALI22I_36245 [Saccharothrix sp. ALI-22-I]|uniref:hypothetical protein n=1 Tax=Saccharothrix sp. ALI-22-I TaxID=1933778 RepID=UPI00097C6EF5|nr:hypothetical protein [Saccharothrix sp. ALI-22-I]ONI83881.1 hypothetical protein ALI22I_36245 [Saccharothrix sp. ALI-22-I]
MDIGEPEQSGRHRLEDGAAIWLPMGGELEHTPHERAVVRPLPAQPPPRDPYVDTDAMGLRKFNIGLVPASVTPPRTWKRAAWFAVLSSAGVLVGLAIAAAELVGSNNPVERIGMPGYPTDVPLLTRFATSGPPTTTAGRKKAEAVSDGLFAPTDAGGHTAAPDGDSSTGPTTIGAAGPTTAPHVTTVPAQSQPVVDAEAMAMNTELFYEEVATDTDFALTMVSDEFQSTGEALLERFADVALIEVTEISVDPAKGITVSTLQVTRKDGSTTTEKRELVFTTVGVPLIDDERPADGA